MSEGRDQKQHPNLSHVLPSKTWMLPTIGQSQSPDAKNLFTMSKIQGSDIRRKIRYSIQNRAATGSPATAKP